MNEDIYKLAEDYFDQKRDQISKAVSIKEMVEIMTHDTLGDKESYAKKLLHDMNKNFRSDVEKCRGYFIKELNISEHYYFSE
jgi:hypothetical protein